MTMHRQTLDIEAFPAWAGLNHIQYDGVKISELPRKGYGLTAISERDEDNAIIVTVPKDLILSYENVFIIAKADKHLREVLDAVGGYGRVPTHSTQ